MFILIGILFMIWSREYQFGTASRMGPGYFPTVLGGLQVVFGLMVMWPSLKGPEVKVSKFGWRGIFVILGAVALYAVLLPHVGFVVALTTLIIVSAWASPEFRWKETLISVVVLGILSYLVFVVGLELQFTVWPDFIVPR
ncbi:MAG: tripartite tricarboxylate transporter TctB family protein [Lautropia sp.]